MRCRLDKAIADVARHSERFRQTLQSLVRSVKFPVTLTQVVQIAKLRFPDSLSRGR